MYEMLTENRPFKGDSSEATLKAILNEKLTFDEELFSKINPNLLRIVTRCLAKKPEHRFQSAKDLAFTLENFTPLIETSIIPQFTV
ncbi:hypothetical protein ACC772_38145, partial [Rhizobium ruizarguesonis]